jgi:glycosyltransferase 2 family protein
MSSNSNQAHVVLDVGGRQVNIEAPEQRAWTRSPGDVLRVIVAVVAVLLSFLLLDVFENAVLGLEIDVSTAVNAVPRVFVLSIYAVFGVLSGLVPTAVVIWLLIKRMWRLLGLYVLSTSVTSVVFLLLDDMIGARLPEPAGSLPDDLPSWFGGLSWEPSSVAALAAALTVSGPWMSRRWRRVAWFLLLLVAPMRFLLGVDVPTGLVFALAVGWLVGAAVVLVFGAPPRNPSPPAVVEALDSSGLRLTRLVRAGVDARGSTPYFAEDDAGHAYFVKVLGADERSADLMFRVYRWFRLSQVGDERPFSSLRRAVEHEALVSVMAERAGVATPPLVATVELPDGSMVLVYEKVGGRSLDKVTPEEVTDEVLVGVWRQVDLLRQHRIAHRDLRRANVFLTDSADPMLIDFGFGEVSASDQLLDQDVAQLLVSTAVDVGAERAVVAAVSVVGRAAVASAAPRMQPIALAGATQSALKQRKGLLEQVHAQVVQRTDLEEIELAKLERIRPRTVVMTALLFLAVWFLIPQLTELPRMWSEIKTADWKWAVPAVVFSMLTYLGAALALSASVRQRLSVAKTTLVTLGGSFVNRVSPAKVGGIALNLRYLQKQGVETPVAAASVGLYQGVGILVHLTLLLVFGVWAGRTVSLTDFLPPGWVALAVGGAVLVIAGLLVSVPRLRGLFRTKVRPQLSKIGDSFSDLLHHPVRLLVMVVGSAVLTLSYIGALWASVEAFGGGLPVAGIAVVFLAGASIASAAPTPGGIGAVEAALVAGLTALGLASEVAVPAVFLYRLATFWVPVLPGWIGFTVLQRRGDI